MAKNPTPAQIAALKKSKGVKPTAAITKPGQKATGLAKSTVKDRFASTAKTPVRGNISGLSMRGSGTPLGTSMAINPLSKKQIVNAALSATVLGRGAGFAAKTGTSVARAAESKVGSKAASKAASSTSKTMNVPKGTKAIISGKNGMANALADVAKVTVQKSPSRIAAGKKTYETVQKTKNANTAVGLATIAIGSYNLGNRKKKK